MRTLLIAALVIFVSEQASGSDNWKNLSVDVGQSTSSAAKGRTKFDIYRLGLQRDFDRILLVGEHVALSGYFEASVNYWDARDTEIYALAFSPVFVLYWGEEEGSFRPYLEVGIGAALLSDTTLAGRDLSTTFQFENRFGAGIRLDRLDFHIRYMHYSNGSVKQPNHGVDAFVLGLVISF